MKADISFETKCIAYLCARSEHEKQPRLAPATGFFWRHGGKTYLVTNRHVVTGRYANNQPLKDGFDPLFLDAHFYQKSGQARQGYTPVELKRIRKTLYKNCEPDWIEHPDDRNFDVVAIELCESLDVYAVNDKEQHDEIWLEAGADCFVVGYPERLTGPALTPIWKRA
ncbi:hypothetical protein AB1A64_13185 [Ruegeria sp. ANG10]|uniref:hypothetical protein n=1 Tax=Ruegeria sp. ANG10 TaxID=3042467 RepID=UPI0034566D72